MTERPPTRGTPRVRTAGTARLAGLAALLLALAVGTFVVPAGAEPVSGDAPVAARAGATWLEGRLTGGGGAYVADPAGDPDISATLNVALALAATGTGEASFDRIVAWFEASVAADGPGGGGEVSAGSLGALLLVIDAAGLDPRDFGSHDLVAALEATLGLHTAGLYGAPDPTYDGVYRHSVALLGLVASGATPDPEAVDWLVEQQCDVATPAARGGWQAFRADTAVPCSVPGPDNYSGADTNQTALAVQALAAVGTTPDHDPLDFLDGTQLPDGAFPYVPGGAADVNSSALVIQAIVAAGEDPAAGRWAEPGGDAVGALLAWQLGCDDADAGAFASAYSDGFADGFATQQAVWGASLRSFPLGEVTFAEPVDPCADPVPTTTTTLTAPAAPPSGPAGPGGAGSGPGAVAAGAVTASPRYTG